MNDLDYFPYEVKWNILKYTRHPLAELFANSEVVQNATSAVDAHIDKVSFSYVFFIMQEIIGDQWLIEEKQLNKSLV